MTRKNSDTRNVTAATYASHGSRRKKKAFSTGHRISSRKLVMAIILLILIALLLAALFFILRDYIKNRTDEGRDTGTGGISAETTENAAMHGASYVIDGDDSTYMLSEINQSVGSYLLLELEKPTDIMSVEILSDHETEYLRKADIQFSSDKDNWTTLGEYTGVSSKNSFTVVSRGAAFSASYIRIVLTAKADFRWRIQTVKLVDSDGNQVTPRSVLAGAITSEVTVTRAPEATTAVPEGYTALKKYTSEYHSGELILVNRTYTYVFPTSTADILTMWDNRTEFKDANGKTVYSYKVGDIDLTKLQATALVNFNAMADAFYKETGITELHVGSNCGWRSKETQAELYSKYPTSAIPTGTSEHNTGLGVNLSIMYNGNIYYLNETGTPLCAQTLLWLTQNAYKYGFVERYTAAKAEITGLSNDSYHYRYVGRAHAYYMTQNNLCLEEYLELVAKYKYDGEHLIISGDEGNSYEVYYVPADKEAVFTNVNVPNGYPYTVSGDNIGGFIVTVTK